MKHHKPIGTNPQISYTILENSSKKNPFHLQDLMYDLPFSLAQITTLSINIIIPKNTSAYIIDDLHFIETKTNVLTFTLHSASQLNYQLFVANHQLCQTCNKKEFFYCQNLPQIFEKTINISLQEENAHAYIKCHYLGDQTSIFKLTTTQHHFASTTTSKLTIKGILDDTAKLVTENTIIVEKNLEKIIAEQENKNLILKDKAHIISIPKLKIASKDIACKHGVSISPLEQNALFYLQSRGIETEQAKRLLIDAFMQ